MKPTELNKISATVNGEKREFNSGTSISALLSAAGLNPRQVAVELNGCIIRASGYENTLIPDGALVEIVHFVGGG